MRYSICGLFFIQRSWITAHDITLIGYNGIIPCKKDREKESGYVGEGDTRHKGGGTVRRIIENGMLEGAARTAHLQHGRRGDRRPVRAELPADRCRSMPEQKRCIHDTVTICTHIISFNRGNTCIQGSIAYRQHELNIISSIVVYKNLQKRNPDRRVSI